MGFEFVLFFLYVGCNDMGGIFMNEFIICVVGVMFG